MRENVTKAIAMLEMRRRTTLIGAMMVKRGEADGMVCGTISTVHRHLQYIDEVLGHAPGANVYAAMNGLILPGRQLFIVDTHINEDPTAEQLCAITQMAAASMRCIGILPKVALLSHSNFGSSNSASAKKMREAYRLLRECAPELEVDGEMQGDTALDERSRREVVGDATFSGEANLLVMPNIDAANIAYNLLKTAAGNNIAIGPLLLGAGAPVNILTPQATVRRIVNVTALTVIEANAAR